MCLLRLRYLRVKKCCIGEGLCVCVGTYMFLCGRLTLQFTPRGVDMAKLQCDQWNRLPQVNNHKLDASGISSERVNVCRCQRGLQNIISVCSNWHGVHVIPSTTTRCIGSIESLAPLIRSRPVHSPFIQPHTRLRFRVPERFDQKTFGVERRGVEIVRHSESTRSD